MVELLATELEQFAEPVTLVGHSMGGKVSMQLALRRPELLRALVVVDIAPVAYPPTGGRTDDPDEEASPFAAFIEAMRGLDLDALRRGTEADQALNFAVPSRMVRNSCCRAWSGRGWGPTAAGAGGSTSTCSAATSTSCAASRSPRRGPPSTARCCGSPGRTRTTSCPRTARTWTRCSRPPGS